MSEEGNWTCADCGSEINSLPFQPSEGQTIRCKECYAKTKNSDRPERKKVQGNWQCASCGKEITELPFNPRPGSDLFCLDCYRSQK